MYQILDVLASHRKIFRFETFINLVFEVLRVLLSLYRHFLVNTDLIGVGCQFLLDLFDFTCALFLWIRLIRVVRCALLLLLSTAAVTHIVTYFISSTFLPLLLRLFHINNLLAPP